MDIPYNRIMAEKKPAAKQETKAAKATEKKTDSSKRSVPLLTNLNITNTEGMKSYFLFPEIHDVSSLRIRWKNLLKRNNISHRGISNCRHTFATHILRDNVISINELSGLLGHSRVSTTLNKYASVIDSRDTQVANKLKGFGYHSVTNDKTENK